MILQNEYFPALFCFVEQFIFEILLISLMKEKLKIHTMMSMKLIRKKLYIC